MPSRRAVRIEPPRVRSGGRSGSIRASTSSVPAQILSGTPKDSNTRWWGVASSLNPRMANSVRASVAPPIASEGMETLVLGARILLVVVFATAGVGKVLDLAGSRQAARDFGVPESVAGATGVLLPLVELAA